MKFILPYWHIPIRFVCLDNSEIGDRGLLRRTNWIQGFSKTILESFDKIWAGLVLMPHIKWKLGAACFRLPVTKLLVVFTKKTVKKLNFGESIKLEKEPKDIYKFYGYFDVYSWLELQSITEKCRAFWNYY